MKTGYGDIDVSSIENTGFNLLGQLMEYAVVNGAKYAKSAGRNNLSGMDIIYGLQYEAHEFPYRNVDGTQTPELMNNSSEDDSDSETDSEKLSTEDDIFTRSTSTELLVVKMNEYHDTWDSWNPELDIQKILKNAVNKSIQIHT